MDSKKRMVRTIERYSNVADFINCLTGITIRSKKYLSGGNFACQEAIMRQNCLILAALGAIS